MKLAKKGAIKSVLITSILLAVVVTAPLIFAGGKHADGMERGQMMDNMSGTRNGQMMNMDKLQDRMHDTSMMLDKAHDTKDMAKRHELMQKSMTQMQEMMGDFRGMMSDNMPGNMNMEQRQKVMGDRMDMMQMMMEHMMGQQSMMMDSSK